MPYEMNEGGFLNGGFIADQYNRNEDWADMRRSSALEESQWRQARMQQDMEYSDMQAANAAAESYWRQLKMQQEIEREANLGNVSSALTEGMVPLSADVDEQGRRRVHLGYPKDAKPVKQYQFLQTKEGIVRGDPYEGTLEPMMQFAPEAADKDKVFAPHYTTDAEGNQWQIPSTGGPAQKVLGPDGNPIKVQTREDPTAIMARTVQQQSMMMYLNEELRAVDDLGLPDEPRRQRARQQLQALTSQINPTAVNAQGFGAKDFSAVGGTNSVQPTNIMTNRPPLSAFYR
jgi:hypothetical protein